MNAVLLIAHAPSASALRAAALHVLPDVAADLLALDVPADVPLQQSIQRARELMARRRGGVLILTDLVGATPCNVASALLQRDEVRLLAGVNLPMLLRALTYRAEELPAMAERALAGGVRGIVAVAAGELENGTPCVLHDS